MSIQPSPALCELMTDHLPASNEQWFRANVLEAMNSTNRGCVTKKPWRKSSLHCKMRRESLQAP